MNSKKRTNLKALAISLFLSSIIISFNSPTILAREETINDTVDVQAVTTNVKTNMLDVNSSVITTANVQRIEGKNQDVKVTFADLPQIPEKIFAVLVDEIEGGVIQQAFLDENNSVEFKNVIEYIKIPGIHLYKQSPTDPDFILRKENIIASTSYLMPYGKKILNNGDLGKPIVSAYNADGIKYENVPTALLYTTTVPQVYSLSIPKNFFDNIDSGVTAKNVLAAVICYTDDNKATPIDVRQCVSSDYEEQKKLCNFEFLLPEGVKDIQIHLYKDGLYKEKFLCKFLININKQAANNYSL